MRLSSLLAPLAIGFVGYMVYLYFRPPSDPTGSYVSEECRQQQIKMDYMRGEHPEFLE